MRWMFTPFLRTFDFSGRSRRLEFWMFFLLTFVALAGCVFWAMQIFIKIGREGDTGQAVSVAAAYLDAPMAALGIFLLVTFIPTIAVQVRRFHDQNLTGALVLLNLIPSIGGLIVLVFMCLPGTPGDNRYGPDPRAA
ncbi:DUF805 domain-containing protein [Sphingomonas sp. LB-2]|uniref:DUF805 domain-containing protein n=1 Tax=Sphingomonas caeni TaxID=2984949 RepID=UPI00222EF818|nr:DUF805 domain-containing protein [Sphingomonas caeni]MCW3847475.1 DUF805 domain-containing protein [Sphingomonas caeni]